MLTTAVEARRVCLLLGGTILLAACAGTEASRPKLEGLEVVWAGPAPAGGPSGWIYAMERSGGRPNACIYVWPDGTWWVGEETAPGAFTDIVAKGRIEAGYAVELPIGILRGARIVYQAGNVI